MKKLLRKIFGNSISHRYREVLDKKAILNNLKEEPQFQQQFPENIAIIFIATNKYLNFFPRFYESVNKYFLPEISKTFFVFTNEPESPQVLVNDGDVIPIYAPHIVFPYINLFKFKFINSIKDILKYFSHIIYFDADTEVKSKVKSSQFFKFEQPLFAVQHYNFVKKINPKQFEQNPQSKAYLKTKPKNYWQACFWGGKSEEFLEMTKILEEWTDKDIKNKIIPRWWDESYLNRYLNENIKKVYTANVSYSFPDLRKIPKPFKVRISHLSINPPEFKGENIKESVRK